jgi:hypothetical protein
MTRTQKSQAPVEHREGSGDARSRFLLARKQAAAHAPAAHYSRVRDMWRDAYPRRDQ